MPDITVYVNGDRPRVVPATTAEALSLVDGQAVTDEQLKEIGATQLNIALNNFAAQVIAAAVEAARKDREGSK